MDALRGAGIHIRRPNPWERTALLDFIRDHWTQGWADEASVAFSHQPVSCYAAYHGKKIVGFAAYECTRRNYFGPTGVDPLFERRGIGTALVLAAMRGLQSLGYSYAIIGAAGSLEYYHKAVGAVEIKLGDGHGVYRLTDEPELQREAGGPPPPSAPEIPHPPDPVSLMPQEIPTVVDHSEGSLWEF